MENLSFLFDKEWGWLSGRILIFGSAIIVFITCTLYDYIVDEIMHRNKKK